MIVEPIFTLQQFLITGVVVLLLARIFAEIVVKLNENSTSDKVEKQDQNYNNSQFSYINKNKWSNNG